MASLQTFQPVLNFRNSTSYLCYENIAENTEIFSKVFLILDLECWSLCHWVKCAVHFRCIVTMASTTPCLSCGSRRQKPASRVSSMILQVSFKLFVVVNCFENYEYNFASCMILYFDNDDTYKFNLLAPHDALWCHRTWSTLVQLMTCRLMAPSHYLNQCWLNIMRSCCIYPKAVSQRIMIISIPSASLKITNLKLRPHLSRAIELKVT